MRVTHVSIKSFRKFNDFKLNFRGPAGAPLDYVILAGPNACGKTTILEAIFSAIVHGQPGVNIDVTDPPQDPWGTVVYLRQTRRAGSSYLALPKTSATQIFMKDFGLDNKIEPNFYLSTGERAVLALALPLANVGPEFTGVVLIDEPELHLDSVWQGKIVRALRGLCPKAQFIIATNADDPWDDAMSYERFLLVPENDHRSEAYRAARCSVEDDP